MKKIKNTTVAQALIAGMMVAFTAQTMAQQAPSNTPDGAAFKGARPAIPQSNGDMNGNQSNVSGDRVVMRGQLHQVGTPSHDKVNTTPLQGFADELPLLTVLKQITPNGWIVRKDDNATSPVNVQKPVSWKGGQSWVNTLSTIAATNNLDVLVNWNENTITVSNSKVIIVPKQEPKVAVFELAGTRKTKDLTTGGSEAGQSTVLANGGVNNGVTPVTILSSNVTPASGITVAPVSIPVEVKWTMVSTKSLRENVEDWAKKAGYRVVWTGVDYPGDDRTLTGGFDSDNGPIHQLSKDYGLNNKENKESGIESRVDQPLSFLIYQNRTLVVEDIRYEQDI